MTKDGKDPETGRFVTGNKFWETHPVKPKARAFETADDLRQAVLEYLNWNDDNPLMAAELVKYEGVASVAYVPRVRAMSVPAMCMHIGISRRTWREWAEERPDLAVVTEWAEAVVFRQKFEGAAADMLNPSLIGRDLGLVDKKDLSSSDGTMTPQAVIYQLPDNGRG